MGRGGAYIAKSPANENFETALYTSLTCSPKLSFSERRRVYSEWEDLPAGRQGWDKHG